MPVAEIEVISVKAARASQLFNSLDPSPFHEKELDRDADAFILGWLQDIGARQFRIEVALPESERHDPLATQMQTALRNHFDWRAQAERRQLRLEIRRGFWAFWIGLSFLAACLVVRELVSTFSFPGLRILEEGLLIIGWVAMWGPIEVFLYGWWPISARAQTLERLANADVSVIFGPG
jgi:hypothetical protein